MKNWYPGIMARAKREIKEIIKLVQLVLEVRDARLGITSSAPALPEMVASHKRIIVFSKADLADPRVTFCWQKYYEKKEMKIFALDLVGGAGLKTLQDELDKEAQKYITKRKVQKRGYKDMRVMIAGIPNVGKSTLLNALLGRHGAKTGDKAGTTRTQQWVHTKRGLAFLDTPGILHPANEYKNGLLLAGVGAIKEGVFTPVEVAVELLFHIITKKPEGLFERYRLTKNITDPTKVLEEVGKRRGCLKKGGIIEVERAARVLLDDFRKGNLGRISLEEPKGEEPTC